MIISEEDKNVCSMFETIKDKLVVKRKICHDEGGDSRDGGPGGGHWCA